MSRSPLGHDRGVRTVLILCLLGLAACRGKCEKLEAKMSEIGMGFSDAEREKKRCNRGDLSDEYIECAMDADSRGDLADCGW